MVAAGGGGAFVYSSTNYINGGDGGTLLGNDGKIGIECDSGCNVTAALGGRQTTGGVGGNGAHTAGMDGSFGHGAQTKNDRGGGQRVSPGHRL